MNKKQILLTIVLLAFVAVVFFSSKSQKHTATVGFVTYKDSMISFTHDPEFSVNYFGTTPRDNNWNIENKQSGEDGYISVQYGKEALMEGKQLIDINPDGKQKFGDSVFAVYSDPLAKTKTFQKYVDGYTVTFSMQNGENLEVVPFVDLASIQINTTALSVNLPPMYTNTPYNFVAEYPKGWAYREYPDTKNGAGFSPHTNVSTPYTEVINVKESGRALDDCSIPFSDYVKISAIHNIQNYEKLNSIEKITTGTGLVGYETTWKVRNMNDVGEYISLPITYFEDKSQSCTNGTGIVEFDLGNKDYSTEYHQMVYSFKFQS